MRRTTTRRAASTGLGALAATTALALAAPSASAATSSVVLDPERQDVIFSAAGYPSDPDQFDELDATPVPDSGDVRITLPDRVQVDEPTAGLVEVDELEEAYEEGAFPATLVDVPVTVDAETGTLALTVPTGEDAPVDAEGDPVDDVYLVVDGLSVSGFEDAPSFQFVAPLDLVPSRLAELLETDPAELSVYLGAFAFVEEPVEAQAGDSFTVELPEGSSLEDLAVEDLADLEVFLVPLEGDELDQLADDMSAAGAGTAAAQAVAAAVPAAQAALDALGDEDDADEDTASAGDEEAGALDDGEDLYPVVEAEGRSATVTTSERLEAGDYLSVLFAPTTDVDLEVVAAAPLVVTAAAPEPTPTVTVTQPAPTATVTAAPPRQNPGLRSNTGVEDAAPGLSGSGLVLLGSGLLAVAGVTGAAVARASRRARG